MHATGTRRTPPLLAASMTAAAIVAAGCGSGTPAVSAPPASRHAAAERAATLHWLAKTNQMWTRNDFAPLDQVTTGEARSAYLAQESQTRSDPGPAGRPPLRLASVSITVPCHHGAASTFVAYGDTSVFTLGQSMQPVALVFRRVSGAWKLAVIVNQPSSASGQPAWPALCRAGAGTTAPAVLTPADYGAALARTLDHAATGTSQTAAAAAPFAVNSFFTGPGSFTAQSATQIRQDRAGGVMLATRFAPADPTLALPLAGGRGYWLVGVLTQTGRYSSPAGIRKDSWPDGAATGPARPSVVHHGTDTYITTYTAIDPLRSTEGRITLDGFFGWPLTTVAS
jgi:hypothetical protein